jgi:hypothetical protein
MATNEARIVISADDKTKGAFDSAKRNMGGLADQAKGMGSSIAGLGFNFAALGGAIAGAFSVAAVKGAIDTLDQLDDLAEKSGIAAESLSALRYAGEVVGTPLESLATGVRKLSLNMAAAAGGGKEQAAAFQAIGVSIKNLDGSLRGSDAMLGDIADKFASFRDGPEKAALAVELFGKAGADMIPLLNKGAAGIEELKNEAASLGVVFSGDLAASAAEFNDNLKKAQLGAEGFAATVAGELLPTLNELAKIMLESKDGSNGFAESIGAGLKTALETVVILGNDVAFVLKGIGREIGAIAAQAVALATLDINGFNAISVAVKEDGVRARKELDALQARILGDGQPAYVDPRILGSVGSIKQQAEALKGVAPVVTKAGAAAKSAADEFQKLWDKIQGKASGTDADFAKNIDLLAGALGKGKITFDEYTQAVHQYIAQQPFAVEAAKAATKAAEDQAKAAEELARIMGDYAKASEAGVAASVAAATQAEAELAQYGLLKSQVQQLTLAHLEQSRELAALAGEDVSNIERRIEAQRRLIAATQGIEAKDIAKESAKEAAAEWSKAADQINQSLSDALMDGFNAGKGFGKSFVDSITSMFKTMVLKPTISAIVTGATGSLGLSGTANAATGGSSLFSSASTAYSLYDKLNTSTALGGLFASNAAYGAAIGTTNIAAGSQAAMLAAQTGEFGLAGLTGTAGAAGSTLAGLAAAAPYLAAFVAAAALISKYANTSTPHAGGGSQYSAAGGLLTTGTYVPESVSEGYWQGGADGNQTWVADRKVTPGYMTGNPEPGFAAGFTSIAYNQAAVDLTTGIAKGIVSLLDSTAETFGKTAGYTAATSFADDSSSDGAWGSLRIANAVGTVLTDWQASESFRTFGDGAAGTAEYQAAIANDVRAVLQNIDLPAWATDMLAALGDTPDLTSLAAGVAQINLVADALDTMRDKLAGFAAMSDTAVSALIKAAGGFEALAASAATYYDNFYSEAERGTFTLTEVAKTLNALNLNLPTTREGFRALLETQQALGNAEGVAALLKVSGAFASVIPATETLTGTVGDLGRAAEDAARAMESAVGSVNDEIKRLRGELVGSSAGGQAYLTAQFATVTGQARAGSVTAMEQLPEISQSLEAAAARNATSSVDLARTRAWIAASLSTTAGATPGSVFAAAPIAQSGSVTAPSSTAQLEALVLKLTAEVEAMKHGVQAVATHASNTNRMLERAMPDGDAFATREAAAL